MDPTHITCARTLLTHDDAIGWTAESLINDGDKSWKIFTLKTIPGITQSIAIPLTNDAIPFTLYSSSIKLTQLSIIGIHTNGLFCFLKRMTK